MHSYKPVARDSNIGRDYLSPPDSSDLFSSYTSPLPRRDCGVSQQCSSTSSSCDGPNKNHPWILNKSLRRGDHEKFFVTYHDHWVIIKCQYQNCEHGSLEANLMVLHCPNTKSRAIYEALQPHLHEIDFSDTVTFLKLKTNRSTLEVRVANCTNERSDDDGNNYRLGQSSRVSTLRGSLYLGDEKEKQYRQWFDDQPIVIVR